ncbi:phosphopantothenoylcysteine decarboxylase domain-containing protein [Crateriforma conspicua]|uniref:Coenzyme A biosynthesis bifunctional protein CoaBC n=1 Tax=Crateriforma conspicua TaxID=2527996 RepID=A0A5C5Y067_9PLAN|nr:phosphopantothenoylcysteine decarboxylase [Crateriforma conspicua]QDV63188.1 Coenzyme A biosynthesis bifunctional protein CoaBC [Crateriforma conspicua]TWT68041.1 Coenzyme A biosynthesis bifunctional protein CoaBC [Crateriforma conspicua]
MARILITSGPTRQYIDPVRYLTNASSGRMGAALASAAIGLGHDVVIISGPVQVEYPQAARVIPVRTTDEMLDAAQNEFARCDGAIGAAAPCDYMPRVVSEQKLSKTGHPIQLELVETPDVVATLGQQKRDDQWVVGFALETEDHRFRATVKLQKKHCDLIVSNGPQAIDSQENEVELLDVHGDVIADIRGSKEVVADELLRHIDQRLVVARSGA